MQKVKKSTELKKNTNKVKVLSQQRFWIVDFANLSNELKKTLLTKIVRQPYPNPVPV